MFSFQALRDSIDLELSEDLTRIRSRVDPEKWRIELPPISALGSTLHADVPEFVPGQPFRLGGPAGPAGPSLRREYQYCCFFYTFWHDFNLEILVAESIPFSSLYTHAVYHRTYILGSLAPCCRDFLGCSKKPYNPMFLGFIGLLVMISWLWVGPSV